MSKTWKRHGGWRDGSHEAKKDAARKFRRKGPLVEISDGNEYRRYYQQWDICDWNCTKSIEQERYEFHHPLTNHSCMCDAFSYRRGRYIRRVACEAPETVIIDRNWVLPPGYEFSRRYRCPQQRVNPETGAYEMKVSMSRWVWKHEPVDMWAGMGKMGHASCRYKDMDWRIEHYEEWVLNEDPDVFKLVEAPYFTPDDVRRHVEAREEQTRNYRKKQKFPRYGRRDRKRARNLKRSSGIPGGL